MTHPRNPNHPKKGSRITVEPIRLLEEVQAIKDLIEGQPRNYLLFVMGINNGLRVGDLLRLRAGAVKPLKAGENLTILESRTGKRNILVINQAVDEALQRYLAEEDPADEAFLFASRKTGRPLTIQSVNALVKKWARDAGLPGNYGAHTLRKTFGYIQRTRYGVGLGLLARRFNHESPAATLRYLGLTGDEPDPTLLNGI